MTEDEILVEETTAQEETTPEETTGETTEEITGEDPAAPEEELQQIQVEVVFPERPFMTTPIDDYTVSEGLLLLIWLTIIVLAILKYIWRKIEWLL